MTAVHRGFHHETDVLIRRVDAQLARLRSARNTYDLDLAERLVACLRQLILATTHASAADRARVRAAVHYFVLRRAGRRSVRPLVGDLLVINDVARRVGRPDLVVGLAAGNTPSAPGGPRPAAGNSQSGSGTMRPAAGGPPSVEGSLGGEDAGPPAADVHSAVLNRGAATPDRLAG
jgi:hypothetical protein